MSLTFSDIIASFVYERTQGFGKSIAVFDQWGIASTYSYPCLITGLYIIGVTGSGGGCAGSTTATAAVETVAVGTADIFSHCVPSGPATIISATLVGDV